VFPIHGQFLIEDRAGLSRCRVDKRGARHSYTYQFCLVVRNNPILCRTRHTIHSIILVFSQLNAVTELSMDHDTADTRGYKNCNSWS